MDIYKQQAFIRGEYENTEHFAVYISFCFLENCSSFSELMKTQVVFFTVFMATILSKEPLWMV
jgi:hypothetical protein